MCRAGLIVIMMFMGLAVGCAQTQLDAASSVCLECHQSGDNVVVPANDHPVGMVYEPLGRRSDYVVNPVLPLPSGRVSCESCHTPYRGEGQVHGALLRPRKELCSACHRL